THARANGIDRAVLRDDGDLCSRARIPRHRLDLDDTVVDLRHLHGEQLRHELGPRARQEDLRAALLPAYVVYIGAHAVAVTQVLARNHFVAADDALGPAEVDDHVAVLDPLHGAIDDFANAILVLVVLPLALSLTHPLHDDLFGVLRGDAAEIERWSGFSDGIAKLRHRVPPLCFLQRN